MPSGRHLMKGFPETGSCVDVFQNPSSTPFFLIDCASQCIISSLISDLPSRADFVFPFLFFCRTSEVYRFLCLFVATTLHYHQPFVCLCCKLQDHRSTIMSSSFFNFYSFSFVVAHLFVVYCGPVN